MSICSTGPRVRVCPGGPPARTRRPGCVSTRYRSRNSPVRHQRCSYSELVSEQERNPRVQTARRIVSEAEAALRGAERGGVRVDGLFHYGAVDLDPQLLVVWILLSGKPDDQLPEWMPVVPAEV